MRRSLYQFDALGWKRGVAFGGPPACSEERSDPTFIDAITQSVPRLKQGTVHHTASWVVARLNYLTCGALLDGESVIEHDPDDFGILIRVEDKMGTRLNSAGIMVFPDRLQLALADRSEPDLQDLIVELLTEFPLDLEEGVITLRQAETKRSRRYGWLHEALLP